MKLSRSCSATLTFLACTMSYTVCANAASADLLDGFKFKPGEWIVEHKSLANGKVQNEGKSSMCYHAAAPIQPEALGIEHGNGCHASILSKQSDSLDYQTECPGAFTQWHLRKSADGNLHVTGHTKVTGSPLPDTDTIVDVTYAGPVCGTSGVASAGAQMQQIQCQLVAKNYDKIKSSCLARNGAANCAQQIAQMDAVKAACGQ